MAKRNSTLDWLRCVAIIAVVNCHASVLSEPSTRMLMGIGGRGVDLFFVLSGWLLGRQLLQEMKSTGQIDARRFWLRRWLRTLPAYYVMLVFSILWQVIRVPDFSFDWRYVVFLQTYGEEMRYFSVSWSLCVEEHFYLAIAPLLLLLRYRIGLVVLALIYFLPQVLRWTYPEFNHEQTQYRYDQCATGVLLAYVSVYHEHWWNRLCRFAPLLAFAGLAMVGYGISLRSDTNLGAEDLSVGTWAAISASWVLLANSSEFWRTGTAWGPVRFLADRAYAIYLTHLEALAIVRKLVEKTGQIPFVFQLILIWVLALMIAEVLHRLVERPLMRSREHFASTRDSSKPLPTDETRR